MTNQVNVIKFDMPRLANDHGANTRRKLSDVLSKVYQKTGDKRKEAILDMVDWAHAYPEYVLDWAGYPQPNQAKSQSNQNQNTKKESEMKNVTDVEVVEVETVAVDETTNGMSAAEYQEFLEYQEFRAWKAQKDREQYARRPIDQSIPRIEDKVVFATPARREPEVKFVNPADILKAQVFIKGQVAKVVHEAEKAYFMSVEWHGAERIAQDVTVDLSGLYQPVTEERGLEIAKSAFENALRHAMHDRFGSSWEYQLESAGVVNPLTVAKAVFRML